MTIINVGFVDKNREYVDVNEMKIINYATFRNPQVFLKLTGKMRISWRRPEKDQCISSAGNDPFLIHYLPD